MTLPPGLQAVRDRADKATWGPGLLAFIAAARTDVPALLDLIETLAGALMVERDCLWANGEDASSIDAALDKYREFK